jgi:hypothetical protein
MSFNFKAKKHLLDKKLTEASKSTPWAPRVITTENTRGTSPLIESSRLPQNMSNTRLKLPAIGSLKENSAPINSTPLSQLFSQSRKTAAGKSVIEIIDSLIRAMNDRLPGTLLSIYHTELMEGLNYYTKLRHNLDLNYIIAQEKENPDHITENSTLSNTVSKLSLTARSSQ